MKIIIKKPLISEKSFSFSNEGKYCFLAPVTVDKTEAKEHIERLFKVEVEKVNSQLAKGKVKSIKGKKGKRSDFKKIIFTLKKGQKIALFEAEKDENDKNLKQIKDKPKNKDKSDKK